MFQLERAEEQEIQLLEAFAVEAFAELDADPD